MSLKNRTPSQDDPDLDYPLGSYKLPPDTEYDLFVSYRGGTGRIFNWLALVGLWNLWPGFCWVCVVCPLILIILVFAVSEPCDNGIPKILLNPLDCTVPGDLINVILRNGVSNFATWMPPYSSVTSGNLYSYIISPSTWFVFLPYAPLVLVAAILFWYPFISFFKKWFGEPYRIFYDKFSINQCNLFQCQQGLLRMCLYLRSSKELLCLFDDEYIDRMWCIFELAVYLKLREKPKVTFVSVSQKSVEVITIVLVNISYILMGWVMYTQVNSSVKSNGSLNGEDGFGGFLPPYYFFQLVVVNSIIFILGQQHQRSLSAFRTAVNTFDVRHCTLGTDTDRATLLSCIQNLWSVRANGIVSSDDVSISNFNDEVRKLVRFHVPLTGPRSWKLFGFVPAVLAFGVITLWTIYDLWSYNLDDTAATAAWNAWNQGFLVAFNNVLYVMLRSFVLFPLYAWAQGAIIRFFWWVQDHLCRWAGVSYKIGMGIGLVVYLVVDVIVPFRQMLFQQFFYIFQAAWVGGSYQLIFAPLQNVSWLWFGNSLFLPDGTYYFTSYDWGQVSGTTPGSQASDPNWYFVAFSVFLATALTILCYYIYEPRWSRKMRPELWCRIWGIQKTKSSNSMLTQSPMTCECHGRKFKIGDLVQIDVQRSLQDHGEGAPQEMINNLKTWQGTIVRITGQCSNGDLCVKAVDPNSNFSKLNVPGLPGHMLVPIDNAAEPKSNLDHETSITRIEQSHPGECMSDVSEDVLYTGRGSTKVNQSIHSLTYSDAG